MLILQDKLMGKILNIRELYKPVQPTVKPHTRGVVYNEFLPHLNLQHLIYCYWELKTIQPLDDLFMYRVISDGCIDIFFDLGKPEDCFIMGFSDKYTEFNLKNSFHYVGVRFLPTAFPQIFNIRASELRNRFIELNLVVPQTAEFISNKFHGEHSIDKIKNLFDEYFLNLMAKVVLNEDNRLYNAIDTILNNTGLINIETDLDTGISPRQLRRLFDFYIGVTAKTFSKVVRFQNILRSKPSTQSLKQNKLYYDVGYYDQAHFIKEFKNFYGVTPAKALGE